MNIITTPINKHGFEFADGQHHVVTDTIVDFSKVPLSEIDEAVAVVWGSSAVFERCLFRGAGKLVLIGSGDADKRHEEAWKRATFIRCIFESFGRRGVEVQSRMHATLMDCIIRNWGEPQRFDVRNFATWSHGGGSVEALDCVYYQDTLRQPLRQWVTDHLNHVGQAWNDDGLRGLFTPDTYMSGVRRAIQRDRYVCRRARLKSELSPQELEQIAKIEAPFRDYYASIGM